jgi:hypothetical protein
MKLGLITTLLILLTIGQSQSQNCGNWTDISLSSTSLTPLTFSCTNNTIFALDNNFELYKSTNNGVLWQQCSIMLTPGSFSSKISTTFDPISLTWFLCYEGQFFYSQNLGDTWIESPLLASADQLQYVYNDSVFFSNGGSFFKARVSNVINGGPNPNAITSFRSFTQTTSNYFYWTISGFTLSLFRSASGIYNGTNISSNLPASSFLSGVMAKGDTLFIHDVQNKKYYFSTNQGNSWNLFYDYFSAYPSAQSAMMAITNDRIYVFIITAGSSYSYISSTADNGSTWQQVSFASTNTSWGIANDHLIVFGSLVNPASLYEIVSTTPNPIYLSGNTWNGSIKQVSQSQNKILMFTDNPTGTFYLSTDNGTSFSELTGTYPDPSSAILTSQAIFINYDNFSPLKSFDNGNSWIACPYGIKYISTGDTVYGYKPGANQKVYYSFNGGLSFDSATVNLANNFPLGACVNGGFVTYEGLSGSSFSFYNAQTQTSTSFTSALFDGIYLYAADFNGKRIIITDDSTNVYIGYSNNNFQTILPATVNAPPPIHPLGVYVENNNLVIALHEGYLVSSDGITYNLVSNLDNCINGVFGYVNGQKLAYRYEMNPILVNNIDRTYLFKQNVAQNCNAAFLLVPDTLPHNYFALNQSIGSGTLNYIWNWGDGSSPSVGVNPSHTYATAGFYNICLTITDGNGCSDSYCLGSNLAVYLPQSIITLNVVSQLPPYLGLETNHSTKMLIYPNPSKGIFYFNDNSQIKTVKVYNAMGQEVLSQSNQQQIDLSDLPSGLYFARVNGNATLKLLKE